MGATAKRLALVGVGKIARGQHLPALAGSEGFELVAAVNRDGPIAGLSSFADLQSMLESGIEVDAVSLCTPPACRYELARMALDAGLHVMLEKPPAATVTEVHDLEARARQRGRTLFTTWHSREAGGVEPARAWLSERVIESVSVTWKEDIRVWHPGQDWILQAGGMGVFDPGINALSILTRILPGRLTLESASLDFPNNCQSPIAAEMVLSHAGAARVAASLDFLYTGTPCWNIEVRTDRETLLLTEGGHRMFIDETPHLAGSDQEYARLYRRFSDLIATGACDVDCRPLRLVEDALMLGRRHERAAFHF
ncbi:Gfo/Idh/MocA family oxidoreductase [Steroidobacter sp. S1-65]|uniref:Gfo/Idh/MocA family oxidoreductase n=1 Tax=Steroidobacter gossypii TaxID=2805490 RepID=A0ABS1WYR5_9GAMM|nr:Gfo/Idh/MocA family oxidoreductase [Steroidobacter gossypii]MBM0106062.1 Gfo/Idh/MocA family oxidoreductase [Steroidobacter gossypii]